MNAKEAFLKISTDEGAIKFAKLVQAGRVKNPFSREQWHDILSFQAAANHPDLSKAQAFSRYLGSEVGRQLYWASKCSPDGTEHLAKVAGDANPLEDVHKADAEIRGKTHARMHSLAVDYQRARGNSYAQAHSQFTVGAPQQSPSGTFALYDAGQAGRG